MLKSIFSKETFSIFKNKKLLIALTAILFIPILYAGMFLWAFWDPYALLEDIPVAVVNEDEGYTFEGEHLKIGDELIDNLKQEADFDFHFVSKEKGYQGLRAEDYYILIEIPEDFSKNATTVLDDPKKLELLYVPNESFNFLASQMGETAMLQIQQALQEKITETYADTIFEKIDDVAIQLVDAADATDELNDGAHNLRDGSKKIADNLKTLSEKTSEFSSGVSSAYDGTVDLADGAATLSSGISELYDNSKKLRDASEDLQSGADELAKGMSGADDGLKQLQENIPALIDGTNELYDGLTIFHHELPKRMTEEISSAVKGANKSLQAEVNHQIEDIGAEILAKINNDDSIGHHTISEASVDTNEIVLLLENAGVDEAVVDQVADQIDQQVTAHLQQYENEIREAAHDRVDKILGEASLYVDGAFTKFDEVLSEKVAEITPGIEHKIADALNEPIGQLQSGVQAVNIGQVALLDGVNELSTGTHALFEGSQKLLTSQNAYVNNMHHFTSSFTRANDGARDLTNGSHDLLAGMFTLHGASLQLDDGTSLLADGSHDLYDGMIRLVDGTGEFSERMHDAADEANDVHATEASKQMIARPVEVDHEKINEVPNYGTGFAPYFLSLGLFVGALLLSIVYPLRETASTPTSGTDWFLRKFLALFSIGVFQALIASGILLLGLGIEVQSVPKFILYAIITSLTFITLIQFFVTCFDDPGRFMAILILILQLTTSAGTFPLELIPKVLQPLNAVLPMTYSVAGFKAVISSGDFGVMWQNAFVLLGFTTIFIVLTWGYFLMKYRRNYGSTELEEALQD